MYMKKENVNDCYKDINLKNIFRNFLMKKIIIIIIFFIVSKFF